MSALVTQLRIYSLYSWVAEAALEWLCLLIQKPHSGCLFWTQREICCLPLNCQEAALSMKLCSQYNHAAWDTSMHPSKGRVLPLLRSTV